MSGPFCPDCDEDDHTRPWALVIYIANQVVALDDTDPEIADTFLQFTRDNCAADKQQRLEHDCALISATDQLKAALEDD